MSATNPHQAHSAQGTGMVAACALFLYVAPVHALFVCVCVLVGEINQNNLLITSQARQVVIVIASGCAQQAPQ